MSSLSEEARDVPRLVADKLARRCWSVDRDELRQEAEAAALHMVKNYQPEKGDLRGYLWRGLARHLTNYMWENGSPVSYKHRRSELRNAHTASVDAAANVPSVADVGDDVGCSVWRTRVAARVMVLAEQEAEAAGFDPETVVPVLLGEATPLAVAKVREVPLLRVLESVEQVQTAMSKDPVMLSLWRELTGDRQERAVRTYRDNDDDDYQEVDEDQER